MIDDSPESVPPPPTASTCTGVALFDDTPFPSWPSAPLPQQSAPPEPTSAQYPGCSVELGYPSTTPLPMTDATPERVPVPRLP